VKLDWTGPALADIRGIDRHLSDYSPATAEHHLAAILATADVLKSYPAIGPALDGSTRSLRVRHTRYILVYRINGTEVEILRVRHDREDWRPE
jgi:toxin ParE1/3/4